MEAAIYWLTDITYMPELIPAPIGAGINSRTREATKRGRYNLLALRACKLCAH